MANKNLVNSETRKSKKERALHKNFAISIIIINFAASFVISGRTSSLRILRIMLTLKQESNGFD